MYKRQVFAARDVTGVSGGSLLGGLLAAVVGVCAAFAMAAGVSGAIGKTTAPSSVQVAPGVTVLSAAAERARQISLCKDLVAGERLISAGDKALLSAECNTNWKAAEHQLPAAARRGALASAACTARPQTRALPFLLPPAAGARPPSSLCCTRR